MNAFVLDVTSLPTPVRLTGEKNIVSADRLSHCFELSADGTTRIALIEADPFERAGKEGFEPCVLLSFRWLFDTPYHSSNVTIDHSSMTLSRATAR